MTWLQSQWKYWQWFKWVTALWALSQTRTDPDPDPNPSTEPTRLLLSSMVSRSLGEGWCSSWGEWRMATWDTEQGKNKQTPTYRGDCPGHSSWYKLWSPQLLLLHWDCESWKNSPVLLFIKLPCVLSISLDPFHSTVQKMNRPVKGLAGWLAHTGSLSMFTSYNQARLVTRAAHS